MSSAPSPRERARLDAEYRRRLTPQEVDAYLRVPISDAEREHTLELYRWFTRRYPTGAERLAYVRRAYRLWQRR